MLFAVTFLLCLVGPTGAMQCEPVSENLPQAYVSAERCTWAQEDELTPRPLGGSPFVMMFKHVQCVRRGDA